MKITNAIIGFTMTLIFISSNARAASFENCDIWLNDQVDFSAFAGEAFKFKNDGSLSKKPKNEIKCIDCEPKIKNQVRIEFKEKNKGMTNWYKQNVTERTPSEFNDVVTITKDEQGRIVNVLVDNFTGGGGAFIGEKNYIYYHQTTSYDFNYDEKGCFPSKVQQWEYAGKNKTPVTEKFEIKKCQLFESLWSKIPSEKGVSYTGITNEPYHRTILPPPTELRSHLAESIQSLTNYGETMLKELNSLVNEKSDSMEVKRKWQDFLDAPKSKCFGPSGEIRSGPKYEKWFLDARKPKPQEKKQDSGSTTR